MVELISISSERRAALVAAFGPWLKEHEQLGERSAETYVSIVKAAWRGYTIADPLADPAAGIEGEAGSSRVYDLTPGHVSKFLAAHKNPAVYSALRYFLLYAGQPEAAASLRRPRHYDDPKPHDLPTLKDMLAVISKMPPREKMVMMVQLYTGARCSDVLALTFDNIKETSIVLKTKGNKTREIVIPAELRVELLDFAQNFASREGGVFGGELVFFPKSDYPTSKDTSKVKRVLGELAKANKQANTRVRSHDFRRFFAVELLAKTDNVYIVQKALGHSRITSTERYLSYSDKAKVDARVRDLTTGLQSRIEALRSEQGSRPAVALFPAPPDGETSSASPSPARKSEPRPQEPAG